VAGDDAAGELDMVVVGQALSDIGNQRVLAGTAGSDDGDEDAVADRRANAGQFTLDQC
jgi:hypothetical protein